MKSRRCVVACGAIAMLSLGSECPQTNPLQQQDPGASGCQQSAVINVHAGQSIFGYIVDEYEVSQDLSGQNNSNTEVDHHTILNVGIHLTIQPDNAGVQGTGEVSWQRNDKLVYRQDPGVCADGQNIDSNNREWTVNLTGRLSCTGDGKLRLAADGSPDGSDIPTTLHYHDYGCHGGCPPCYDATTGSSELVTWNGFDESGFRDNELKVSTYSPIPSGFTGIWKHAVDLQIADQPNSTP